MTSSDTTNTVTKDAHSRTLTTDHNKDNNSPDNNNNDKKKAAVVVIPPKKPKLSKAERRALQEAQRAAKGQAKDGGSTTTTSTTTTTKSNIAQATANGTKTKSTDVKDNKEHGSSNNANSTGTKSSSSFMTGKVVSLFSHLPNPILPHNIAFSRSSSNNINIIDIHPEVIRLGHRYAHQSVTSSNDRCRAMLQTFQTLIRDTNSSPSSTLTTSDANANNKNTSEFSVVKYAQCLDNALKSSFTYWTSQCRVHSVSMGNAMSYLKVLLANVSHNRDLTSEKQVQDLLCDQIDAFVEERVVLAQQGIVSHAMKYIFHKNKNGEKDKEVILIYGADGSEAVEQILCQAIQSTSRPIRIICVDARPNDKNKSVASLIHKLQHSSQNINNENLSISYIHLNALSYVMKEVTRVLLGADALMSNGSILARVGSANIALMAQSYNVPVLFCCETYKISARLQLESITYNELGDPAVVWNHNNDDHYNKDVVDVSMNVDPNLSALHLVYDLTPAEFVSGIVTEMGILPPSSVAVLLREMSHQQYHHH